MLGLELVAGSSGLDRLVQGGYCGDLLSDVMANGPQGGVWLTSRKAIYGRAQVNGMSLKRVIERAAEKGAGYNCCDRAKFFTLQPVTRGG